MNEISIIILCRCKFQAARPHRIFINRINNGANAYLVKTEQKWHLALSRGKCIWLGISMTKDWTRLASEHPLCYEIDVFSPCIKKRDCSTLLCSSIWKRKMKRNKLYCIFMDKFHLTLWQLLLVSWKLKFWIVKW